MNEKRKTDAVRAFLVIWAILPVIFFSFSQSKLPGYILPTIPAWTVLLAFVLASKREGKPSWLLAAGHAIIAAAPVPAAVLLPSLVERTRPGGAETAAAILAGALLLAAIFLTLRVYGWRMLRLVTVVPLLIALAYVLRVDAPMLDAKVSMRPLAQEISRTIPPGSPVAVFHARREVEYGLAFYFDRPIANYDRNEALAADHLVVAPKGAGETLAKSAGGRRVSYIGRYPPQNLELFWISSKPAASVPH